MQNKMKLCIILLSDHINYNSKCKPKITKGKLMFPVVQLWLPLEESVFSRALCTFCPLINGFVAGTSGSPQENSHNNSSHHGTDVHTAQSKPTDRVRLWLELSDDKTFSISCRKCSHTTESFLCGALWIASSLSCADFYQTKRNSA